MSIYVVCIVAGLTGLAGCCVGLHEQYREWARLRRMAAEVAARKGQ